MRYTFAVIMLSFAVIAFYQTSKITRNKTYKKLSWCLYSMIAFSSAIWSLGYGVMYMTDDFKVFSIFRIVGMVGIILIMVSGQVMIGIMSATIKKLRYTIIAETLAGIAVLYIIAQPKNYEMFMTDKGIVTAFTSTAVSLIYTIYVFVIAIIFVIISVMLSGKSYSNRVRAVGRAFLKLEILIGIGMIVDTVLPALGINLGIPASTLLQYGGVELFNSAVIVYNRNNIDMANVASYIARYIRTPVMVFDSTHRLRVANAEAIRFFELDDEDVDGANSAEFWPTYFGKANASVRVEKGQSVIWNLREQNRGRSCRLMLDAIYDNYNDYLGYIVSVNDTTNEEIYLNDIRRAKEEAEIANRAKSQFLANMSHEIRTPMNAIIGFSEMGLKKTLTPEESREFFKDINTSAEGLLSIINSILSISKIESGKMELIPESYSPREMFEEVSKVFTTLASSKGLSLDVRIADNIPNRLIGDRGKIREILFNLLGNAIKYTETGTVGLTVAAMTVDDDSTELRFRVEDTGMGIKEEDLEGIFESFKRVDLNLNKKTEGTGLGLSIVKGYVDLMDGIITVKSSYGKGTVFTVRISQKNDESVPDNAPSEVGKASDAGTATDISATPSAGAAKDVSAAASASATSSSEASAASDSPEFDIKQYRILAVDDTAINLKVVKELFRMYGVDIDTATSGQEAIDLAGANAYDVILMDQMMPEMDGIEAMHRIRELGNGYENGGPRKIIAVTANEIEGVREMMLEEGFDDFLGKPVKIAKVEDAVRRAMTR